MAPRAPHGEHRARAEPDFLFPIVPVRMELNTDIAMTHALIAERPDAATAEDWFEAALSTCSPLPRSIRNSWGDEEDAEEEVTEEDDEVDDEEPDPFEDFDEDDFDDEFDDDFEEELEDEYEIEPADDGMLEGHPDAANIDDDDEETGEVTEDEE